MAILNASNPLLKVSSARRSIRVNNYLFANSSHASFFRQVAVSPKRVIGSGHASERPGLDKIQRQYLNGDSMKNMLQTLLLVLFALPLVAQGAPPQNAADQPYVMEYYYKVQWGHQQEFLQLFLKNHYPLLRKEVESGRMLSVK